MLGIIIALGLFFAPAAAGATTDPVVVNSWGPGWSKNRLAEAGGTWTLTPGEKHATARFTGKLRDRDPGRRCAYLEFRSTSGAGSAKTPRGRWKLLKAYRQCGARYEKVDVRVRVKDPVVFAFRVCQVRERPVACGRWREPEFEPPRHT